MLLVMTVEYVSLVISNLGGYTNCDVYAKSCKIMFILAPESHLREL